MTRLPFAILASLLVALAQIAALPAAAISGYHGAYFSESSFLTLSPGQSGQFAVGFTNTGDQGWVKGTTAQASLHTAAPLDNSTDFTAGWSSNWASANVYANQSTDLVAPSQIGFFVYNITVPSNAPSGVKNFYGRPAVAASGFLEDYGYFQALNVQSSALTITGTVPASPATSPNPQISGGGAPAGATVTISEGGTIICTATATSSGTFSCGASNLASGTHSFVASTPGAGSSAPFSYTLDLGAPGVSSASTTNTATVLVNFTKQMKCSTDGALGSIATASNYAFTTSPGGSTVSETPTMTVNSPSCTQATLVLNNPLTNGSTYAVTVNNVQDASGNVIGTSRTATFTVTDSGVPTASAQVSGSNQVTVTYSKAMNTTTTGATGTYKLDSVSCTSVCSSVVATTTGAVLTFNSAPTTGTQHTLDITGAQDSAGNTITPNPTSISLTWTASTARPSVTGVTASTASKVTATFSTSMDSTTATTLANYQLQKSDGNQYSGISSITCQTSSAACTSVDLIPSTALVSGSYSLVVQNVKDNFGNFLLPNPTVKGPFSYSLDTSPPTVTSVSASQTALNTATISITFSKAMKSITACNASGAPNASSGINIDNKGDYTIAATSTGSSSDATTLNSALAASTSASISGDCRSVTFTLSGNFNAHQNPGSGDYTVAVQSMQDQAGNQITASTTPFIYVDNINPVITTATWSSATVFSVTYSKTMRGGSTISNSAGNPLNYAITPGGGSQGSYGALCASGGTANIAANTGLTQFTITCSGANGIWAGAGTNTVTVQNVADYNGNIINPNPRSQAF